MRTRDIAPHRPAPLDPPAARAPAAAREGEQVRPRLPEAVPALPPGEPVALGSAVGTAILWPSCSSPSSAHPIDFCVRQTPRLRLRLRCAAALAWQTSARCCSFVRRRSRSSTRDARPRARLRPRWLAFDQTSCCAAAASRTRRTCGSDAHSPSEQVPTFVSRPPAHDAECLTSTRRAGCAMPRPTDRWAR